MSRESSPRGSSEQRRPLTAESFDSIDDLETVGNGRCSHHKRTSRSGDGWYRTRKRWNSASAWLRPRNIALATGLLAALLLLVAFWHKRPGRRHVPDRPSEKPPPSHESGPTKPIDGKLPSPSLPVNHNSTVSPWEKPKGFKIIGLVFFGRPLVVEILDCYLKRNLVLNGGFLDEVLFVGHTDKEEDLEWMYKLVEAEPLYRSITIPRKEGYDELWAKAVDDKNMFIKIDDDMVSALVVAMSNSLYAKRHN